MVNVMLLHCRMTEHSWEEATCMLWIFVIETPGEGLLGRLEAVPILDTVT